MKIYVPPIPNKKFQFKGEWQTVLLNGISLNERVSLCDSEAEADIIVLDFRHVDNDCPVSSPQKTVLLDYRDHRGLFDVDVCLYFKRSVVSGGKFVKYDRDVIPISYCIRNEAVDLEVDFSVERTIDICHVPRRGQKTIIGDTLKPFDNTFVGHVGKTGPPGRNVFQAEYFEKMLNSKIVVTCNPDRWEGDYRLFEALSCGCLVFVDKMLTPVKHPFADGVHLVYFDRDDPSDLHQKLKHYLNNPDEGLKIAEAGYRHARRYHTAASRIDEILDEFAARQSARSSRSGALSRSISKAIGFCRAWAQRRCSRHATRY